MNRNSRPLPKKIITQDQLTALLGYQSKANLKKCLQRLHIPWFEGQGAHPLFTTLPALLEGLSYTADLQRLDRLKQQQKELGLNETHYAADRAPGRFFSDH